MLEMHHGNLKGLNSLKANHEIWIEFKFAVFEMKIEFIGHSFEGKNGKSWEAVEQLRHVWHGVVVLRGDLNVSKLLHGCLC